jgi:hypothetical protein
MSDLLLVTSQANNSKFWHKILNSSIQYVPSPQKTDLKLSAYITNILSKYTLSPEAA